MRTVPDQPGARPADSMPSPGSGNESLSTGTVFAQDADVENAFGHRQKRTAKRLLSQHGELHLDEEDADQDDIADKVERSRASFATATAANRATLAKMQRLTINPLSPRLRYWDACIVTALLYTAFVTPFEVRAPLTESHSPAHVGRRLQSP